jgi:hypothetical protein
MRLPTCLACSIAFVGLVISCSAQQATKPATRPAHAATNLQVTKTIKASGDTTTVFALPILCDADSNIYMRTDSDGFPSIHKLKSNGDLAARYTASSCPEIRVQIAGQFTVAPDERVYQFVFAPDDVNRYLFVFNSDGTCHSTIKLDAQGVLTPYQIVVFPSGNMLIAGQRWSAKLKSMLPYTALFNSSGTALKEIDLDNDAQTPDAEGPRSTGVPPDTNVKGAISGGSMQIGGNGNVYLMRKASPATIYAISEGGMLVRRFVVDPGDVSLMPLEMQVAGTQLAIFFRDSQAARAVIEVVDLEGHEVARYDEPPNKLGRSALGAVFACYSTNPDRFVFLTSIHDRSGLNIVEAR